MPQQKNNILSEVKDHAAAALGCAYMFGPGFLAAQFAPAVGTIAALGSQTAALVQGQKYEKGGLANHLAEHPHISAYVGAPTAVIALPLLFSEKMGDGPDTKTSKQAACAAGGIIGMAGTAAFVSAFPAPILLGTGIIAGFTLAAQFPASYMSNKYEKLPEQVPSTKAPINYPKFSTAF